MEKPAIREVKIRCVWCEIADTCKARARKEKYEESGMMTKCRLSPNHINKKKSV